jgi:hypothetical protein
MPALHGSVRTLVDVVNKGMQPFRLNTILAVKMSPYTLIFARFFGTGWRSVFQMGQQRRVTAKVVDNTSRRNRCVRVQEPCARGARLFVSHDSFVGGHAEWIVATQSHSAQMRPYPACHR